MYDYYIEQIHNVCRRKNLAAKTERAYTVTAQNFFKFLGEDHEEFTLQDVNDFIDQKIDEGVKPQSINTIIANLRFFYKRVLKQQWDYDEVLKLRTTHKIPIILSKEEVAFLIDSAPNLKYKAIFSLIYSSGLRVSEVVSLKYEDISRVRKQVHISESKNRWERYSILSDKCLDILTEYWFAYGKPRDYLFPSRQRKGNHLSYRTIQETFTATRIKAGFPKGISIHTLRHCFATHLADDGVDIRVIQHLMGHKCPASTGRYLHLTNYSLQGIKSPYDVEVGDSNGK